MIDCKIDLNLILISLHLILGGGFAVDNVANKPFTQECTDLPTTTTATSDTTVPTEPPQSKSIMGSNIFSKIDPKGFRGIFFNFENELKNGLFDCKKSLILLLGDPNEDG